MGDLTSALHMGRGDASVPALPSTAHDQMADMSALGCSEAAILNVASSLPRYPVPRHQSMPRQEPG
jgi:hypothetical protein